MKSFKILGILIFMAVWSSSGTCTEVACSQIMASAEVRGLAEDLLNLKSVLSLFYAPNSKGSNIFKASFDRVTNKWFWQDSETRIERPRKYTDGEKQSAKDAVAKAAYNWHFKSQIRLFQSTRLKNLIDAASANLAAHGVLHIVNKGITGVAWSIEILPDIHGAELNQIADSVLNEHHSSISYDPFMILGKQDAAYAWNGHSGRILLSTKAILSPERPPRDLFHEISHANKQSGINARKPSEFYGEASAIGKSKRLPHNPVKLTDGTLLYDPSTSAYASHFSFDELVTYYDDISSYVKRYWSLKDLLDGTSSSEDEEFATSIVAQILSTTLKGYSLSIQAQKLAEGILNLGEEKVSIQPYKVVGIADQIVHASVQLTIQGEEVEVHFPLVKSIGFDDPKNTFYFIEQARLLQQAAKRRAVDFLTIAEGLAPSITGRVQQP